MDIIEEWIMRKKIQLFRKGITIEKIDDLHSQIQNRQIKFIEFKKEYQNLKNNLQSTSRDQLKRLKMGLRTIKDELRISIKAVLKNGVRA